MTVEVCEDPRTKPISKATNFINSNWKTAKPKCQKSPKQLLLHFENPIEFFQYPRIKNQLFYSTTQQKSITKKGLGEEKDQPYACEQNLQAESET